MWALVVPYSPAMATAGDYERIEEDCKSINPKDDAGIFSILSFWWMGDVFRIGNKRQLENHDLLPLCQEDKTRENTKRLSQFWERESSTNGGWRLLRALLKSYPVCDYLFILCTALLGAVCNTLQPLFLSFLMAEIISSPGSSTKWAYIYGMGICVSSFLRVILSHQFMFNGYLMSMRWKAATTGLVYNKVKYIDYW